MATKNNIPWWILGSLIVALASLFLAFQDSASLQGIYQFKFFESSVAPKYLFGSESVCKQAPILSPTNTQVEQFIRDKVEDPKYQTEIIEKLSGLIQIPSESYDDLGPIGQDARWDIFYQVEKYIKTKYPTVLKHAKLDHVNTHGLIFTWEGSVSTKSSKPILLLAHQDVVPVLTENVPDWTHPPYEGHFDGKTIWGRGSTDDKGYLISIIESMDLLMKSGFKPKRTIILAFGCDEEISGRNCARPISELLHDRYGDQGIYMMMDEGSFGLQTQFDQSFAMVSVAEKGYMDMQINVTSPGGHAANPPDHNAIGVLSEIIMSIENHPFPGKVTTKNPIFNFLECAAVHAPERSFPLNIRNKLQRVENGEVTAQVQLAKALDNMRYFFRTSQSVGKINGGVKINAIPELASTMVNLRLAVDSSVAEVQNHYENLIRPISRKHGMSFQGFYTEAPDDRRKISLSAIDALEPAPVSPVNAEAFRVLSGTIRNTLKPLITGQSLVVTPYLMPANTDTKFFWKLTQNIYRFTPINLVHNLNRAHTTDEFIVAEEFVREPLFFATLILNADDTVAK